MSGTHTAARPESACAPPLALTPAAFTARAANDNRGPTGLGRLIGPVEAVILACEVENGMPLASLKARLRGGGIVPLATTRDPDDFVALWRGLGRELNAALEVLDRNGKTRVLTYNPGDIFFPRWRGSQVWRRRTRFARKRFGPLKSRETAVMKAEESA